MFLLWILYFSLLIKRCLGSCGDGCLRCSAEDRCLACEYWANFYLDNGTCVKKTLSNCQLISQSGDCLQCAPSYFFDLSARSCAAVPTEFKISGCEVYSSDLSCKFCAAGHFFKAGNCTTVDAAIPGCVYYATGTACQVCESGKVLSPAGDTCSPPTNADPNCASFSTLKCNQCADGFLSNPNLYILRALDSSEVGLSILLKQVQKNLDGVSSSICSQKSIANCKKFKDYNSCEVCEDGYYIVPPNKCNPYPKPIMDNCAVYVSDVICKDCLQGFFLKKPDTCAPVMPVTNCTKYATNTTDTKCIECQSQFYVGRSGFCEPRILSLGVENCTAVDPRADQCANCSSGLNLTDDQLRCLPWPANCATTAESDFETGQFTCQSCVEKYYLDTSSGQCKPGSIANCVQYQQTANSCTVCADKFYNVAGECSLHSEVVNCTHYHSILANTCTECSKGSLLFAKGRVCTAVTPMPGCVSYATETTCKECSEGFRLTGTTCTAIATELNCLTITSDDKCLKCKPTHTLNSGTCVLPFAFLTDNCLTTNLASGDIALANANCLVCKEGNFPSAYLNHYLCMENSLINTWTTKTFTNCRMIGYNAGAYYCRKCAYGKFLGTAGDCVDACPSGTALSLYLIEGTTGAYYPSKELFCTSDPSCKILSTHNELSTTDISMTCAACIDGYAALVNPNTDLSVQQKAYDYTNGVVVPTAPVVFHATVTCTLNTNLLTFNGVNSVENCEYYYTANAKNGCLRCKHGYTGTLIDDSGYGFIKTCAKMTACDDSITRPGLTKTFTSLISCHKCIELSKIPFVFVRAGTTYNDNLFLKSYTASLASPKTAVSGGVSVDCLSPTSTTNSYVLSSLPANCGVGLINIEADTKTLTDASKSTAVDRTKIAAFCVACTPGFKITAKAMDNAGSPVQVKHMVPGCASIPNCQASTWFNYCTTCQDNFAFGYTSTTGVQYDNCVQYAKDPNCFAADITNPLSLTCAFCKKGYTRNEDNLCVQLTPPRCKIGKFMYKRTYSRMDFNTILFLRPDGEGCNECESGYTAVQMITQRLVCTASTYIATNTFPTPTAFITNCKTYGVDAASAIFCNECKTDFILSTTKLNCFPSASLKYCAVAFSQTVCNSCTNNYIVIAGKCESKKILQCKTYVDSRDSTTQVCLQCNDGYYLKAPDCVSGNVKYCKQYGDGPDQCLSCLAGYQLIYQADQKIYCYPLDPSLSCARFKESDFAQGVLTCSECTTNQFVITPPKATEIQSVCLTFQPIDNCSEYALGSQVVYSGFKCKTCVSGYFVKDGGCQLRKAAIPSCDIPDPAADLCQTCSNSTYISADRVTCTQFPVGVGGCRLYTNDTSCIGCKTNFYFNATENRCLVIDSANIITNCLYYNQFSKCDTCAAGFVLSTNRTCEQVVAKNCLTFANKTACGTCEPGKGLKNETGIINCIAISDANCGTYEPNFPFKCLECKPGYILDKEGLCQAVVKAITGCLAYSGEGACKRCQVGLVLVNATSCAISDQLDRLKDPNCADVSMDTNLSCNVCKGGYWFNGTTCVSCGLNGCHLCNPLNTTICVMCQTGFFMDRNGTCQVASYGQSVPNNTNTTDATILAWRSVLVLMIALWLVREQ